MVLAQFAQYLNSIGEFTADQAEEILNWRINLWHDIYLQSVEYLTENEELALMGEETVEGAILLEEDVFRTVRDKAIISILLETGLSISEVIALKLSELNLENEVIALQSWMGYQHPISQSARLLKNYLEEERPDLVQSRQEEIVFISQFGGAISRQGVWQILKTIGERLDPPMNLSPRALRNTAVKHMIDNGMSMTEIQEQLGHRNIYSTRALVRKIKRTENKQESEDD